MVYNKNEDIAIMTSVTIVQMAHLHQKFANLINKMFTILKGSVLKSALRSNGQQIFFRLMQQASVHVVRIVFSKKISSR